MGLAAAAAWFVSKRKLKRLKRKIESAKVDIRCQAGIGSWHVRIEDAQVVLGIWLPYLCCLLPKFFCLAAASWRLRKPRTCIENSSRAELHTCWLCSMYSLFQIDSSPAFVRFRGTPPPTKYSSPSKVLHAAASSCDFSCASCKFHSISAPKVLG